MPDQDFDFNATLDALVQEAGGADTSPLAASDPDSPQRHIRRLEGQLVDAYYSMKYRAEKAEKEVQRLRVVLAKRPW